MSEEETTMEHVESHGALPLLPAFIALLVMTVVEVLIAEIANGASWTVPILLLLTVAKATTVGAVFMEIAYSKDTRRIVTFVFIVPLIAVFFLIFTILADWR